MYIPPGCHDLIDMVISIEGGFQLDIQFEAVSARHIVFSAFEAEKTECLAERVSNNSSMLSSMVTNRSSRIRHEFVNANLTNFEFVSPDGDE